MSIFDPSVFRAYDMRGTYPNQINEEVAYAVGQAFVKVMQAKNVVVGRDVRATGVSLQNALIKGITDAGANVIEIGVISTEMLYFASATLECDGGVSITASHNPPQWNGIKFIGKGAEPITREGKLGEIYKMAEGSERWSEMNKGTVEQRDLLPDYIQYLQKFVPKNVYPAKIVANPNFGANGKIVDMLVKNLPLEIIRLNWQEDGTFPKGTPDPLLPHQRKEVSEITVKEGANFAACWDADADRCFFFDEKGRFFHGYYVTALLIKHFLSEEPGVPVISERRLQWANRQAAKEGGSTLTLSRTGHGYIKKAMRDNQAIFAGEMSGHYYYRDFFFCDNGLVTFLTALGIFSQELEAGRKVSDLLDYYLTHYPINQEELNFITPKAKEIIAHMTEKYQDAEQDPADGISIEYPEWRFNLRMSDNEPVLRLNMEAKTAEELKTRLDEVMGIITSFGATLRNDE